MVRGLSFIWLSLALCTFGTRGAYAQEAISSNDFRVDLSQGLVLSGSRIVGVAGAFTALGTGIDGAAYNPASYAARDMWEHKRFTWGMTLGLSFPGRFGTDDYFNSNRRGLDIEDSLYVDLGLRIQVGYGAGGILGTFQQYSLNSGIDQYRVRFGTVYSGLAGAFFRESLIIGVGVRTALLQVDHLNAGSRPDPLVSFSGLAPQFGALIRPEGRRFRIGAAIHMPVDSRVAQRSMGTEMAGDYYLPSSVNLPWQVNVGAAFQLGERPMNIYWQRKPDPAIRAREELEARRCARIREELAYEAHSPAAANGAPTQPRTLPHPERCARLGTPVSGAFWAQEAVIRAGEEERLEDRESEISTEMNLERWRVYDQLPRRYFVLTMDLGVIGAVDNSVGVDAFLDQERRARVSHATPTFALGFEAEPWRNRLKLRVGSYIEPARNVGVEFRVHGTGGFDIRLFRWALFADNPWDFRVGFVFDGARDYVNFGITAGFWH